MTSPVIGITLPKKKEFCIVKRKLHIGYQIVSTIVSVDKIVYIFGLETKVLEESI